MDAMNDFPTVETDRLLLREMVAADAPAVFAIHSAPDAMRWFGTDPLTELSQAHKTPCCRGDSNTRNSIGSRP